MAPAARAAADGPAPPKGMILVDADTGAVLDGLNAHQPELPASLTKIITALTAVEHLPEGSDVPVSARAEGQQAESMNMKAGQVWKLEDVLGALLVSSANDAAMALAERVAGSAEAFQSDLAATATRLGMADHPILRDPAGLDDGTSVDGGNRLSARDLAIAARALLAEPRLAPIVATKVYRFTGPDGVGHRLGNHNRLLSLYNGAIGMKTGYTKKAMHGLVAAATRDGRTMISVILGASGDTYGPSASLLDRGFATPLSAERDLDHLPQVAKPGPPDAPAHVAAPAAASRKAARSNGAATVHVIPAATATAAPATRGHASPFGVLFKFLLFSVFVVIVLRTRVLVRAARRRDPDWPHLKMPALKLPDVKIPSDKMPSVTVPKFKMPSIKMPNINLPRVQLPRRQLPKVRVPRPRMPVLDLRVPAEQVKRATSVVGLPVKRSMAAPQHAKKRTRKPQPAHRRPAPAHRRVKQDYEPTPAETIDPKLAQRFEILARTGQVVR